ncbi:unnamed protein product [Vicia faba]|uniref:Uncharacterized protein n=1 Tax=Vicia faba TaxID=3906 RepID=A0AAV0YN01_VICFA|nr:unnamed protein product [Vicia faba]
MTSIDATTILTTSERSKHNRDQPTYVRPPTHTIRKRRSDDNQFESPRRHCDSLLLTTGRSSAVRPQPSHSTHLQPPLSSQPHLTSWPSSDFRTTGFVYFEEEMNEQFLIVLCESREEVQREKEEFFCFATYC